MTDRSGTRARRAFLPTALAVALLWPTESVTAQDNLITLSVRDEELSNLLEALAVQHRLNLVAGDNVTGRVTINLYDVPLEEALTQILATQGLAYIKEAGFYRILTVDERAARIDALDEFETRVITLNHLTSQEARQLLTPLLSTEGKLSLADSAGQGGGASSGSGSGGATSASGHREVIVVLDRKSRVDEIARAITELDRPPQQVLLEATILSIDLGEDNRLGVDFNVLGGIDFEDVGAATDFTGIGGGSVGGALLNDSLFSGQSFGFTNDPPSSGLSLGFVKNNVAAFVEALEQTTNATIVSNPRVLALNGNQAEIIVGGRLGYSTLVTTETSSIEEIQFLDTGTQLVFTPYIGEDGWIRMAVHPQNSTGVVDPVSGIPSESTTEITTNILMKDGQTLILGGLISESVSTTRSQIPILGNIPFLGALFGRTVETINRRELVILMTPHILDPADAQLRADEAKRRFETVRRSHWESLSPYIRPVLARQHQASAEVQHARGHLSSALGSVERALALNPTYVPAGVLRAQLVEELALEQLPAADEEQSLLVLQALRRQSQQPEGR